VRGQDQLLAYVGEQVQVARLRLRLTQDQLAKKAGCGARTIYIIESARQNVTLRSLSAIADALGLEVAELFPKPTESSRGTHRADVVGSLAEDVKRAKAALASIEALIGLLNEDDAGQSS
jgi:transcriptional regulator with XRE-family HTH domain